MRIKALALAATLAWTAPASATVTVNIANAPGWQTAHAYTLKDRVVAGAGWNGSAYTNGSALCVFAVTVAGTGGSDPTVFNTACASGTPAGVGGGLDGSIPSGWASASSVTDGGVTWKLLSPVDYVTLTGFNCDDSRSWAQSTTYAVYDFVVNSGHCYSQGIDPSCSSAGSGSGPTGTTAFSPITDNTCSWYYQGEVTYTSTTHRLPHQTSVLGVAQFRMQYAENYIVNLIYGGQQRQSYKPGANGELTPLQIINHADLINDALVLCSNSAPDPTKDSFNCLGTGQTYTVTFQCYSGDCWHENAVAGTTPLWYDLAKGVNIYNDAAQGANGAGDALNLGDSVQVLAGLQMVSEHAIALSTTPASYSGGPTNTNIIWVNQAIIVGGDNGNGAFTCDIACNIANSFIASRSTLSESVALSLKYQGIIYNSTLVCASGVTNSTGVQLFNEQSTPANVPWKNNAVIGCTNPFAYSNSPPSHVDAANNATNVASAPTNTFTGRVFGFTYTAAAFPGTSLSGITTANQFTNPTLTTGADWRVKSTSADIYGGGASFSFTPTTWFVWMGAQAGATPDIYGTTRPTSSRYDIGANQFVSGVPAGPVKGGKIRGGLWH